MVPKPVKLRLHQENLKFSISRENLLRTDENFLENFCWSRSSFIELFPLTFFQQFLRPNCQTRFDKFSKLIFSKISATLNVVNFPQPAPPSFQIFKIIHRVFYNFRESHFAFFFAYFSHILKKVTAKKLTTGSTWNIPTIFAENYGKFSVEP